MDAALLKEKDKRKISAAFHRQILEFRGRYEVLLDEALRQNTVLLGRVEEARRVHSCVGLVREVVEEDATVIGKPSKAKVPAKKTVSARESAPVAQAAKENDFIVVVGKKNKRKKKKKKKSKQPAPEKATKTPGVVATATKKAKAVEREKARAPARAFVVSAGDAGAEAAKRQLWADLVKGVAAPKLGNFARLPRGDLVVKPADDATYKALKEMEASGKMVTEEKARWPTVLIYDVDRDFGGEVLPVQIVEQNSGLGLVKEDVVPLFKKGPKTGDLVWWVCSVRPSAFKSIVGKSLFIGLSKCRTVEYVDVNRCFKCQGFGHMANRCKATEDTCGRCAAKGHRAKDCQSVPVKCANCGQAAQSGHKECSALHKATIRVGRRTDFGSK
ncbi:unnamed protein product [Macrosiphum euphorbiae]|uniref:CCHC-type domain-containing protein n=1 Tax=Macrosiphum euphorbiae TaxID=13131 RepID=A0AAV0XSB3_9HEMI|nr:unnamed protein product [Macrosiphum euphorbiae]